MSFKTIVNNSRTWWAHASAHGAYRIRLAFHARPLASASVLVAAGLLIGVAGRSAAGMAQVSLLQAKAEQREAELDQVRRGAQQEINAMAARLGELQAQANRLNALGERLTRVGQLQDGEFDFNEPVGVGGNDVSYDMKPAELVAGVDKLEQQFAASGRQLSVL
ncbi:MAG: M23 family peptidase, partial [Pseudoxanthomonas sp.]|nr:M23 family peptidase [Pseudoxanthomonas sp.]